MSSSTSPQQPNNKTRSATNKRQMHRAKATRIMISLPAGVITKLDEVARQDYTSRSDVIRMAILWYLRPQGRDFDQTDPEQILKTLQHRQARVSIRKMLNEPSP